MLSSVTAQTLIVDVPDNEWLTANGRRHWSDVARRTRALRTRAAFTARNQRITPVTGPVRVVATVAYSTQRRADPGNAAPTVKALVDGLTDVGVWPDDNSEWLVGPDYRRDPNTCPAGWHRVVLFIDPLDEP